MRFTQKSLFLGIYFGQKFECYFNDRSNCTESQREAALLLGQFAAADSDCKVD